MDSEQCNNIHVIPQNNIELLKISQNDIPLHSKKICLWRLYNLDSNHIINDIISQAKHSEKSKAFLKDYAEYYSSIKNYTPPLEIGNKTLLVGPEFEKITIAYDLCVSDMHKLLRQEKNAKKAAYEKDNDQNRLYQLEQAYKKQCQDGFMARHKTLEKVKALEGEIKSPANITQDNIRLSPLPDYKKLNFEYCKKINA